jgi:hypothetical protein
MNKFLLNSLFLGFIALALLTNCSVTSEKFRFQWRFDHFFNLLNDSEKNAFREDNLDALGSSLEQRLSTDKKLKEQMRSVQFYEAITSFDAKQTGHYYREIILKELNRPQYYRFMKLLDAPLQSAFAKNDNFSALANQYYQSNAGFKAFIDNMKTEYRLYGFSNEQVYYFFRNTSFPEVSRRNLYPLLKILKASNALADFKTGNLSSASAKLDEALKTVITTQSDLDGLKTDSGLTKADSASLIDIYYHVILKEMDQGAVEQTLSKF